MAKQKETSLFYRSSAQPPLEFPKRSMDVIMPWKTRFRSVNMPFDCSCLRSGENTALIQIINYTVE